MSDIKISEMTVADSVTGADLIPIIQGGSNKSALVSQLPTVVESSGSVINILDYGAVPDLVTLFDITMPNGNVITSAAHTFTDDDIGKWAVIRGATNAGVSPMVAQITAVSGHTATLSKATTSALTNVYADSFPRMDFGTDNSLAIIFACLAVPGPGHRNYYGPTPGSDDFFTTSGVMNPILPGDGGTVYIPRGNYLMLPGQVQPGLFWWFEANNITIKGDGMGQSVLFMCSQSGFTMPLFGGFVVDHGLFQNITFQDYTIYDLNYYTGGGNSLDIRGANNVRIERIEICNSRGNGGINYQGYNPTALAAPVTNRLWIKDCWVHGITEDGYTPSFPHSIEGDGINVGQMRDVHIEGNTIEGPGRQGYEGGGNCADQYFIGNTVDMKNGGLSGLNATGGSTTVFMGNTIRNVASYYGIDVTVDVGPWVANNIRCIGNYIHGSGQAAFRFQNTSGDASFAHVDNILVASNWVEPTTNIFEYGVLTGGSGNDAYNLMIEGNWFGNHNVIFGSVNGTPNNGNYVIIKNNFCVSPQPSADMGANVIIEGNISPATGVNRYGSHYSCGIDGHDVLAGATYSAGSGMLGGVVTDTVEIVRGTTTAPGLIIWGVVTGVSAGVTTVTTYAYNPTGSTLNTGATCEYIVHRPVPH